MSHEDGASTDVTGKEVAFIASITEGNGSLTSPEKLKPLKRQPFFKARDPGNESTKNGIDHMIRVFQSRMKITGERYLQILQLGCQSLWIVNYKFLLHSFQTTHLIEFIFALLWVIDCGPVPIVPEVPCSN